MRLVTLEKELEKVHKEIDTLSFSDLIRRSRDAVGMMQYRAGEFAGVSQGTIKNLETGYFRQMPTRSQLLALGALWGIEFSVLEKKAKEHVAARVLARKVRVISDNEGM